jgi:hypothetical protein
MRIENTELRMRLDDMKASTVMGTYGNLQSNVTFAQRKDSLLS